jgi:hypothetical protein
MEILQMTCKSCIRARTPPRKGCAETTWNVSRLVVAHDPVAANRRTVARGKEIADLVMLGQQCSVINVPHPVMKTEAMGSEASVVIKRTDFNAGMYAPCAGHEVTITISLEALKG